MSSTKVETTQPVSSKTSGKIVQDTRIDAAHPINVHAPESTPAISAGSAIADSADHLSVLAINQSPKDIFSSEQLQRQAEQLAEYLRKRQNELDHREAQLNAEISLVESDVRNARMCLTEREAELEQGRQELDLREKEFLKRLERLAAADAALKRQAGSEDDLNGPSAGFSSENKQFNQLMCQRESQLEKYREDLQQRQLELENAENHLAQAQAETQKLHEQLLAERLELREEIHRERQRLIVQQRQALAELEKKRQILQHRSEHVDQCRAALLQLRAELQQMHRETLEIRLSTEELWIKLSGAAPPAALTHSLGQIRNRLADQYRLANAELHKQRKEIESIRDQLVEQYEKLVEQKRQFEHWMACKQGELQEQASRLIAREQTLLQQQTCSEEQSQRWQLERMQYEQEIRRLRLKLALQNKETANA